MAELILKGITINFLCQYAKFMFRVKKLTRVVLNISS
jgi:hypothetical protein